MTKREIALLCIYGGLSAGAALFAALAKAFPGKPAFATMANVLGVGALDVQKLMALLGAGGAARVTVVFLLAGGVSVGSSACGSKVPSVPQQADVAAYTAALETCITTAKATDAGTASYVACRNHVDQQFGRTPEEGGAP
jgi:hypothetical protein